MSNQSHNRLKNNSLKTTKLSQSEIENQIKYTLCILNCISKLLTQYLSVTVRDTCILYPKFRILFWLQQITEYWNYIIYILLTNFSLKINLELIVK